MLNSLPADALRRFFAFITKSDDPDGCWIWTGMMNQPGRPRGRHGQNRYPRPRFIVSGGHYTEDGHRLGQVHVYAHRLMLSLASGVSLEAARGLDVHHACGNRQCVCPWHLEWKSPEEHRDAHAS